MFIVVGDPLLSTTLYRASVDFAYRVVLLQAYEYLSNEGEKESLLDASAVAMHKRVCQMQSGCDLVRSKKSSDGQIPLTRRYAEDDVNIGMKKASKFQQLSRKILLDMRGGELDNMVSVAPRVIVQLHDSTNAKFTSLNMQKIGWFGEERPGSPRKQNQEVNEKQWYSSSGIDYIETPSVAAGIANSSSFGDGLLINNYFNPMVGDVVEKLILSGDHLLRQDDDSQAGDLIDNMPRSERSAVRKIFSSAKEEKKRKSAPPAKLSRALSSPFEADTSSLNTPVVDEAIDLNPQLGTSSFFAVEVPITLVGQTYQCVLWNLLKWDGGILPLGLYRSLQRGGKNGEYYDPHCDSDNAAHRSTRASRIQDDPNSRVTPYGFVYVNPPPHEIVTGNDLLYVLAQKQPEW